MIDIQVLFDVSNKCVDLLDALKKDGVVEINGFLFLSGDEDLLIAYASNNED